MLDVYGGVRIGTCKLAPLQPVSGCRCRVLAGSGCVLFGVWVLVLLQDVAAGCWCQICMAVLASELGFRCRCKVPLPDPVYVE